MKNSSESPSNAEVSNVELASVELPAVAPHDSSRGLSRGFLAAAFSLAVLFFGYELISNQQVDHVGLLEALNQTSSSKVFALTAVFQLTVGALLAALVGAANLISWELLGKAMLQPRNSGPAGSGRQFSRTLGRTLIAVGIKIAVLAILLSLFINRAWQPLYSGTFVYVCGLIGGPLIERAIPAIRS
jgi:hypothetical protein